MEASRGTCCLIYNPGEGVQLIPHQRDEIFVRIKSSTEVDLMLLRDILEVHCTPWCAEQSWLCLYRIYTAFSNMSVNMLPSPMAIYHKIKAVAFASYDIDAQVQQPSLLMKQKT